MREYKFRGKTKATGEWVYGYLLITQMSGVYIIGTKTKSTPHKIGGEIASVSIRDVVWQYEVDPDTAGQYTGLHDKNGKGIYEGDIVKLCDTNPILFRVEIILARYGYKTVFKLLDDGTIAQCYFLDKCEVVGNIHDNPELLKEVE
jgi:uncharacterized phage protein (TIGR01671 family)